MTNTELRELSRKLDKFNMEYYPCSGSCASCKNVDACLSISAAIVAIDNALKNQAEK